MPESTNAQYRDAFQDNNTMDPTESCLAAGFLQDGPSSGVDNSEQTGRTRGRSVLSNNKIRLTSRPKRPLSAFETYVRFEMMVSPGGDKELSVEESEGHWKDWSVMPSWKKEVYQDLAAADEIRYKKELQVWEDGKSSPSKIGDYFKARLFQKKVSSFQQSRSAKI
uniref:HMG box domain-containing protein n=1 Tax=Amphora coffeiformis TaxID=265554 RepID=A0A7S3PAR5_9STRA|mmetsp:Transcript_4231/g.8603  ORF Transcript_4231/g.8603 Transcript_4231/m.8603 type:complete len:166 (+) Transcript_4231:183-680(+)|eukprot:scaffold2785_cov179-Amphora_coffeaeformis.AAC.3